MPAITTAIPNRPFPTPHDLIAPPFAAEGVTLLLTFVSPVLTRLLLTSHGGAVSITGSYEFGVVVLSVPSQHHVLKHA